MGVTAKRFVTGSALTNAWVSLFTVVAPVMSDTVKQIIICNTDTVARTYSIAVTPNSTAPTATSPYIMWNKVTLASNVNAVLGLTDVIPQGSCFFVKSDETDTTAPVTITVSGGENT